MESPWRRARRARVSCRRLVAALEELHRALVLLGRRARLERAEVLPLPGLGILLPRVQAVLARLELADHGRRPRIALGSEPPRDANRPLGGRVGEGAAVGRVPAA